MSLRNIRRAVREDVVEYTNHALDEMDQDGIGSHDVKSAILMGDVVAEMTDDPRGKRYVVRGTNKDGDCNIEVVCRFLPSGLLRIITVYALE